MVYLSDEARLLYHSYLQASASLSRLFSESSVPFLQYRVVENAFCHSSGAMNLSRADTAFDAKLQQLGIGLKTFVCQQRSSREKVAEFNALAPTFRGLHGLDLARYIIQLRNERIELAQRLYGIDHAIYHIVARRERELVLFDSPYHVEDVTAIQGVKEREQGKSLFFSLGTEEYSFNRSKSTLYKVFRIPEQVERIAVDMIEDPFSLLLNLSLNRTTPEVSSAVPSKMQVILPLYSSRDSKTREVALRSGLNQWNASGRPRSLGEVYIPIPAKVHQISPDFFPQRDEPFLLQLPTGERLPAKVCQEGRKALMTNPNEAISDWLLRHLFKLKEGELLTRAHLDRFGFDSVRITKEGRATTGEWLYSIDKAPLYSYEYFIGHEQAGEQ